MNENARLNGGGRDADGSDVRPKSVAPFIPPFRIIKVERCNYGSKKAQLLVELDGFGSLELDLFAPENSPSFIAPRSIRDRCNGGRWARTFKLDDDFASEVLEAALARLDAELAE